MNLNVKGFISSLATNMGPLAPALLLAAGAAVWFASGSIKTAASTLKAAQESTTRKVTLRKTPIDDAQALQAAQRLAKLSPTATIAVSGNSVVISIGKPELFAEWTHAMTELQSVGREVQWTVVDMCIASCEGGEVAKAYVTAYRPRLQVE